MKFHVYQDAAHEWRWRLVSGNNRIIADSGEGYVNHEDCLAVLALIGLGAQQAAMEVLIAEVLP